MDNTILLLILVIVILFFRIWTWLVWLNAKFNDEDDDITDSHFYSEYWIRKIARFFTKK